VLIRHRLRHLAKLPLAQEVRRLSGPANHGFLAREVLIPMILRPVEAPERCVGTRDPWDGLPEWGRGGCWSRRSR
jgi:hypothetical protein